MPNKKRRMRSLRPGNRGRRLTAGDEGVGESRIGPKTCWRVFLYVCPLMEAAEVDDDDYNVTAARIPECQRNLSGEPAVGVLTAEGRVFTRYRWAPLGVSR